MSVTAQGTGTQAATINTEHTLLDVAIAGTFTLHVSRRNQAAGDVVELRIYQVLLTGDTREIAYFTREADAAPTENMILVSVPISNELTDAGSLRFTLKQTKGTGRNWPWKVLKY